MAIFKKKKTSHLSVCTRDEPENPTSFIFIFKSKDRFLLSCGLFLLPIASFSYDPLEGKE